MVSQDEKQSDQIYEEINVARSPIVSVVMAVYNGERYLQAAIQSIIDQTFDDFEFIIIDDGSSDRTASIIDDFRQNDSRVRVFTQRNSGLTNSLIKGVILARGQFIARMDADDISCPTRLDKQVRFLQSNPHIELVSSNIEFMDDMATKRFDVTPLNFPDRCVSFFMPFFNVLAGHGQVMFTRRVYDKVGGYNSSFQFAQDYDLWERMGHATIFGKINEVLYRFRTSTDSITKKNWEQQQECRSRVSRRSYEFLTGHSVDPGTIRLVNEFWHGGNLVSFGIKELIHIDRVQRRAFRAWNSHLTSSQEALAVKRIVSEQFAIQCQKIPIRWIFLFGCYCLLIAIWDLKILFQLFRARLRRTINRRQISP